MLPKKLPTMLYTLPRLMLFSRSCLTNCFVYRSICPCDCQCNFSPHVFDRTWLCLSLCSQMYHPLSSDLSSRINAWHPQRADRLFACNAFPCFITIDIEKISELASELTDNSILHIFFPCNLNTYNAYCTAANNLLHAFFSNGHSACILHT